jgi:hypothetical protein
MIWLLPEAGAVVPAAAFGAAEEHADVASPAVTTATPSVTASFFQAMRARRPVCDAWFGSFVGTGPLVGLACCRDVRVLLQIC